MRTFISTLVLTTMTVSGSALAGPKAAASADKTVDLRQYRTFGFAEPLGTDQNGYQSILSQNLKASTQRQLEARGLVLDQANPQLLINFNARLDDKMKVSTTPAPPPTMYGRGYYGYRGSLYSTWPMYQDQTTVRQYKEGTLNIDVVDQTRKQLVWEAVVTDTITQKKRDHLDKTIEDYVKAAFKKYPVAAPKAK